MAAFQTLNLNMIAKQASAYVGDTLGNGRYNQAGGDGLPPLLYTWINQAQIAMCAPELGVQDLQPAMTVPGQRNYPIASGCVNSKRLLCNNLGLTYCELIDLDWYSMGNSQPTRYAIWKGEVLLGPLPPDQIYPLKHQFYRLPTELVVATDVPELPPAFHMALVYGAAAECARADGEPSLAQDMDQKFERLKMEFQGWVDHQTSQNQQVRNVDGWGGWGWGRGGF